MVTVAVSVATLSADLKVYISADMEGIGGVSTWDVQAEAKGREYEKFRRLMTLEVNAAVEAAFEAGASEVLVSDSHGDAQNIDVELLDKRARLIRSWPRPLGMMQGIDESFAAAALIGYHAAEGSSPGVLAHTFTGKVSVALNGTAVPEAGISAAIAGEFGVPIVFVSGDQVITRETKRLLGNLETATVKEAIGFSSAIMIHPELAQRRCIVDLVGKHARIRTVPVPTWVKVAIDAWTSTADITRDQVFRSVNRADQAQGALSEKVVWQLLQKYAQAVVVPGIAPHDLRRTCAKMCRPKYGLAAAGERQ